MTADMAESLGINAGDALALLAIESRFGNADWKGRVAKGPLQIEEIAFKDIQRWYKSKSKPAGMNDSEWERLKGIASTLTWNNVKNDESSAIAAALLYFKQIQLMGVKRQFWGAAFNDGPYKFLNKGVPIESWDELDKSKIAKNHSLESIQRYQDAWETLSPNLDSIADDLGVTRGNMESGDTDTPAAGLIHKTSAINIDGSIDKAGDNASIQSIPIGIEYGDLEDVKGEADAKEPHARVVEPGSPLWNWIKENPADAVALGLIFIPGLGWGAGLGIKAATLLTKLPKGMRIVKASKFGKKLKEYGLKIWGKGGEKSVNIERVGKGPKVWNRPKILGGGRQGIAQRQYTIAGNSGLSSFGKPVGLGRYSIPRTWSAPKILGTGSVIGGLSMLGSGEDKNTDLPYEVQTQAEGYETPETNYGKKMPLPKWYEPDKIIKEETPDPSMYTADPGRPSRDTIVLMDQQADTKKMLEQQNQRTQEYQQMARIARINGDMDGAKEYSDLAIASQTTALGIKDGVRTYNSQIILAQGMQGINELQYGNTNRVNAVWSDALGLPVRLIPRSDGKFDLSINGEMAKEGMSLSETQSMAQLQFNSAYRSKQADLYGQRQQYLFEKGIDLQSQLAIEREKILGNIQVEAIKAEAQRQLELVQQLKGEFMALGDGSKGLVRIGQAWYLFDAYKKVEIDGVDQPQMFTPIPAPNMSISSPSGVNAYLNQIGKE